MGELPSSGKVKYGDSVHNAMRLVDDEGYAFGIPQTDGKPSFMAYVYDPVLMDYIVMQQPVIEAGTVNVVGPVAVTGPLTDAELRNSDVKVTLDNEKVVVDTQQDMDMSATYTDGKLATMTIVGLGKTKTMTFGWTGDDLTSITTNIT